jgi:dienelactone hydrolase
VVYDGAQHSFDEPGARKQSVYANRQATLDARKRAAQFFAQYLGN